MFRQIDPTAKAQCEVAISQTDKLNAGELLLSLQAISAEHEA
jgi:hypothetical protein